MVSVTVFRSFHGAIDSITHLQSLSERPGAVPIYNANAKKLSFAQGLALGSRITSANEKRAFVPCLKASESTTEITSVDGKSQEPLEKRSLQSTTFPNGFEALVLEVCDETNVAELKLKVGDFEMHLKRNIDTTKHTTPIISPTPPHLSSEPMVKATPVAPPSSSPKSSSETASPFKNKSSTKSSKLAALEASGANSYVLVSSPKVGSFRRGKTVKGKKQPPICKEGDVIKEGQTIGYLNQFGSELPVMSDVAGEVLKFLYNDGDAVGYGDPLVAILPSFHDININ
ncbi:PREDICTED: uncharacterized protein LOC104592964 isoform X2 [Nelumbo nucifera]|uniref:Uncharacterized protein LOC104592964 isoform X2 n=1 Tax=Nelumbo nucifera TaxID=4432 RepID=A0A1U8Q110_NELNU|nr:PREDICTED: uncharacterized protein LOC104592964 isoform X2 [Nelumbo nucifera]